MSRSLNDLAPDSRPLFFEFLARLVEANIDVIIVETLRTPEQQKINLAKGVSWTPNSRHLTGHAIDICPYETYALHGPDKLQWDATDPIWNKIGQIGESLGLRWGGRWQQKDMGHFEVSYDPSTSKFVYYSSDIKSIGGKV